MVVCGQQRVNDDDDDEVGLTSEWCRGLSGGSLGGAVCLSGAQPAALGGSWGGQTLAYSPNSYPNPPPLPQHLGLES